MENQEQAHVIHEGVSFFKVVVVSIVALLVAFLMGGGLMYFVQGTSFHAKDDSAVFAQNLDFPVVVYGRPGLLNNTEEGRVEKEILQRKLVQPYLDYHNEEGVDLLTLRILVPVEIGESYSVLGIFVDGVVEEFSFGVREGEYGYWEPMCMGECEYSDAFRAKYPEIVGE